MQTTTRLKEQVNEYVKLYDLPLEELQERARKLTRKNFGDKMELCSIVSAKTGRCSENCKYCAQSSHYKTSCETHDLLDKETVLKAAHDAKANGACCFSIVTSGKGMNSEEDFAAILDMVREIAKIDGLNPCCSFGILSYDQVAQLKEAGIKRIHHNVNTASSFYNEICSTHTFEERLKAIRYIKEAGVELCCGGIIGMGETREQRIEMALEIKDLNPVSLPINILFPVPGTPLENIEKISTEEILKTIAIYRILLPDTSLRLAGGRSHHLGFEEQLQTIQSSIDAMMIGNYLTTSGPEIEKDLNIINQAGKECKKG